MDPSNHASDDASDFSYSRGILVKNRQFDFFKNEMRG